MGFRHLYRKIIFFQMRYEKNKKSVGKSGIFVYYCCGSRRIGQKSKCREGVGKVSQ